MKIKKKHFTYLKNISLLYGGKGGVNYDRTRDKS